MHPHTHTHRAALPFTTCTVQLQGSFSVSQTTQPNKHIQLHFLRTAPPPPPCSSRLRSHSLHWGHAAYRWVKFTSLRKLFDITNKVKVYQKTPEDYIIMACQVARCTSRSKIATAYSAASWLTYQCAEHTLVEVTQERPRGTQRGLQLTRKKKIIAHYQPSILSTMKHL